MIKSRPAGAAPHSATPPSAPTPPAKTGYAPNQNSRNWGSSRKPAGKPLLQDEVRRQGLIIRQAMLEIGDAQRAITFLNAPSAALGGSPLQVATATPGGFRAVELLLQDMPATDRAS